MGKRLSCSGYGGQASDVLRQLSDHFRPDCQRDHDCGALLYDEICQAVLHCPLCCLHGAVVFDLLQYDADICDTALYDLAA